MRKKGFTVDASVSILLTIPEGVGHRVAAESFLSAQASGQMPLFVNAEEGTVTIDMIREVLRHSSFARAASEPQAVVICAVQTATIPAQNALLKIIEEPPAHTQFVLTTYPGHSLLPTIVSRCREILWTETAPSDELVEETPEAYEALVRFFQNPGQFAYHEQITLAEQFKDTAVAKKSLKSILIAHASILTPATNQAILAALSALERNGNVRLTLEHCFFTITATQNG